MFCKQKRDHDISKTKNYLVQLSEAEASSPMCDLGAGKMPPDEYLVNYRSINRKRRERERERERGRGPIRDRDISKIMYRVIHTCGTSGPEGLLKNACP